MRLTYKPERWSHGNKIFVGKRKNYNVNIVFTRNTLTSEEPFWWFSLYKGMFAYNSLWDDLKFETQEECVKACEQKIDELVRKQKNNERGEKTCQA